MKKPYTFISLPLVMLTTVSCSRFDKSKIADEVFNNNPIINFDNTKADNDKYQVRHGYGNGGMFMSKWTYENFSLEEDGVAQLSISDKDGTNYGAEIKTYEKYQYGYFGARMKPEKRSGTVQSFFTYTGPSEGANHDEIDIEFLGKDITKVQFNYYHNGKGDHEYLYDLGFDASKEFHDYGFKWEEDKITWFVDFEPVYQVKATVIEPQSIFANTWAGNMNQFSTKLWLGQYTKDENKVTTCCYDYFSYQSL